MVIAGAVSVALAGVVQRHAYAATPQQAAIATVYRVPHARIVVVRTNVAGRYATVVTRGGMMEGSPATAAILVQRFSFGWQPLESLDFRCRLDAHDIPPPTKQRLMAGMPPPQVERSCSGEARDSGPPAQVEAVRRQMQGPLVPQVTIAGRYALGQWYGAGGGQWLFASRGGSWHFVAGGGGAMGVREMRRYHVPSSAWCTFHLPDAHCSVPRRRTTNGLESGSATPSRPACGRAGGLRPIGERSDDARDGGQPAQRGARVAYEAERRGRRARERRRDLKRAHPPVRVDRVVDRRCIESGVVAHDADHRVAHPLRRQRGGEVRPFQVDDVGVEALCEDGARLHGRDDAPGRARVHDRRARERRGQPVDQARIEIERVRAVDDARVDRDIMHGEPPQRAAESQHEDRLPRVKFGEGRRRGDTAAQRDHARRRTRAPDRGGFGTGRHEDRRVSAPRPRRAARP